MPRSVKLHPSRKPEVLQALKRNDFLTQGYLAAHLGIALSTVNHFINSKSVYVSKFEEICEVLGLDPKEMVKSLEPKNETSEYAPSFPVTFFAYDESWVGREKLIGELSDKLMGSCRLLLILGLTGIGKTALGERIALEMQDWLEKDWQRRFLRVSFEVEANPTDFVSVAVRWLEEWGIGVPVEQREPERVLEHLMECLRRHPVLVLIDSLENLLAGNEEEGWGNFADPWWERFFVRVLSAPTFESRILVTSQDLPLPLVQQRYSTVWHRHVLTGLEESEQEALFETTGLDVSASSPERSLLLRLGKAYQGHPLVLRVIIGEIWESFEGNVQAYWEEVKGKIEEVEKALTEAEADARKVMGADDRWKLHKLTRKVRLEVNKQRLRSVFERLSAQVPDAYWLICTVSVYRTPVQVEGWLMQLANLVKRLENQACSEERLEKALEELSHRFLVEESVNHNNKLVLGLHHLIRSIALEHYQQLISNLKNAQKSA